MPCGFTGRIGRVLASVAALLALSGSAPRQAGRVDARQYESFWIWSGATVQPDILRHAHSLYLLQGEISPRPDAPGDSVLTAQGVDIPQNQTRDIWLVYRANTLAWPPLLVDAIVERMERWRHAGNPVVGVQIDFDSSARGLPHYVDALRGLRARLPASYRLSVTGLLDWTRNGAPLALDALAGIVDEVVVQTYQGRQTIPDHERYFDRLDRLPLPFKIGLIQNGAWTESPKIQAAPQFHGYVVFLLPPVARHDHDPNAHRSR